MGAERKGQWVVIVANHMTQGGGGLFWKEITCSVSKTSHQSGILSTSQDEPGKVIRSGALTEVKINLCFTVACRTRND